MFPNLNNWLSSQAIMQSPPSHPSSDPNSSPILLTPALIPLFLLATTIDHPSFWGFSQLSPTSSPLNLQSTQVPITFSHPSPHPTYSPFSSCIPTHHNLLGLLFVRPSRKDPKNSSPGFHHHYSPSSNHRNHIPTPAFLGKKKLPTVLSLYLSIYPPTPTNMYNQITFVLGLIQRPTSSIGFRTRIVVHSEYSKDIWFKVWLIRTHHNYMKCST